MARSRMVKSKVWQDEALWEVSRDARLLFVGLITLADDEGRFLTLPNVIAGHIYPRDNIRPGQISKWLAELEAVKLIQSYGEHCGWLPGWHKNQQISHPSPSVIPPPPITNGSGHFPESLRKPSGRKAA